MENLIVLTKENFDETIKENDVVLVDFWADWCGPCKMLLPVIGGIADEFVGKAVVCKVNVDEQPELAERFSVETIPTVIIFKGGEEQTRSIGFRQKPQIVNLIEKYL